jgi:acyl-coenzyme A thioesterase PaaI-like protein
MVARDGTAMVLNNAKETVVTSTGRAATDRSALRPVRPIPVREEAGIRDDGLWDGGAAQALVVPEWLRDKTGAVVPGAIGMLADSVLGSAVMSSVAPQLSMVTSHLHLEIPGMIPPVTDEIRGRARGRSMAARYGVGEGEMHAGDGTEIAQATIGSVLIPFPKDDVAPPPTLLAGAPDAHPSRPPHRLVAGDPLHVYLGTDVVAARRTGVKIRVAASPRLANSSGGLHGGVGLLLGERVLDLALDVALRAAGRPRSTPEGAMRLVELRAAFVRRVPADWRPIACHGAVLHLGRRLAAGRAEVQDQDGRPAVLVDATFVAASHLDGVCRQPGSTTSPILRTARSEAAVMEQRPFGRTGIRVSAVGQGTMTFGNETDPATSTAVIDAGGTFIDTANTYNVGASAADPSSPPSSPAWPTSACSCS